MKTDHSLNPNAFFLLRAALLLIGLHSIILGTFIYFFTDFFYQLFFSTNAENIFFVRQAGVFLFLSGLFYLTPLMDLRKFVMIIIIMILSKASAFIFLVTNAHLSHSPMIIYIAALGDGSMAVVLSVLTFICFRSVKKKTSLAHELTMQKPEPEILSGDFKKDHLFKAQDRERDVLREIQMSMLASEGPLLPDRKEVSVHAAMTYAPEWGGDFYNYFFIDKDHFCFFIGDVSGKGVPSALVLAVTSTLIKARAKHDLSPASILTFLNDELSRDSKSGSFVTLFLGVLNVKTGEMVYANTGHPPPYLKREKGIVERLDIQHGPVIGAIKGMVYKESRAAFSNGDLLVMYNKGLTGARDVSKTMFSEKGLAELLSRLDDQSAEDAVRSVESEVRQFIGGGEQRDDITLLAVKFVGRPADADVYQFELTIKNQLPEIERATEYFDAFAAQGSISKTAVRQIKIALDELLNNVISYAYNDDSVHDINLKLELFGDRLTAVIADDGMPFNPFGVEAPDKDAPVSEREIGGLGIHLVRNVMDEVAYERRVNENITTMIKYVGKDRGA